LTSLGKLEEREDYESDASRHDHGCDSWNGCHVSEEDFIVEDNLLGD